MNQITMIEGSSDGRQDFQDDFKAHSDDFIFESHAVPPEAIDEMIKKNNPIQYFIEIARIE